MTKTRDDVLAIMRRVISRRNANDPDSTSVLLTQYINDFYSINMTDDVKLFEQFDTLQFTVDNTVTTGVYSFDPTTNNLGSSDNFVNITLSAFCNNQVLNIYQDPKQFYLIWNEFDTTKVTTGQPTDMLFYDNEFVFRPIPDQAYTVRIFAYKQNAELSSDGDPEITRDYWYRYLAYGAALDYMRDFNYSSDQIDAMKRHFNTYRKWVLTRSHNQYKQQRAMPRF